MANPFIRIETSDEETRWINLDAVARVTLGRNVRGEPTLILFTLASGDGGRLEIHGDDPKNVQAIESLVAALDRHDVVVR